MTEAPVQREWHSSDLTAKCLRAAQLKLRGQYVKEAPKAMFRGSWSGAAVAILHSRGFDIDAYTAVDAGLTMTRDQYEAEGTVLTEATERDIEDIRAEILPVIERYIEVFYPLTAEWSFIGAELPVYMDLPDGHFFSSHLDLLFRDDHELLRVLDCKWWSDAPMGAYLGRNPQLAAYWLAVKRGSVRIKGDWIAMDEYPLVSWIHLPYLKPFNRKTTVMEYGEEVTYHKGDDRPLKSILRHCYFREDMAQHVIDDIMARVSALNLPLAPTSPDPVGCLTCQSEHWCTRYDTELVAASNLSSSTEEYPTDD